jgi:ubiquinone biosynthesis protein UbiJ
MFEILTLPAINRLLRTNSWALERLRPHAGKTALLTSPPFELRVTVSATGELAPAAAGTEPQVTISASPGVLLRLAARDETAWNAAQVTGDMQFAAAIDHVRTHIAWDYEEDLSKVFGDVAAHRLAGAVRGLDRWGRTAAVNLAQSFAEYATHEQPMIASGPALETFSREVDDTRDAVERLEKRVEHLERR